MEHKICCENIPEEFFTNKDIAKRYFRKFGKFKRIIYKPKSSSCTVEYSSEFGSLNALANAGEYQGVTFKVKKGDGKTTSRKKSTSESPERPVKKTKTKKDPDPDWLDDPEVRAELEAMGGVDFLPSKQYNLRPELMQVDPVPKEKAHSKSSKPHKLKRSWKAESPSSSKKKKTGTSVEKIELIKIIRQQAVTVEDKYKILDARDKLIRLTTKRKVKDAKSRPTVGTCPDMCPEKERLMREIQHQVAIYEQEFGGRSMNPSLAVKQYSRSSADQEVPLPHELRPVAVLQMTMAYLMHQIMGLCDSPNVNFAEWYHFLWDRTRGIRKDITQQELCSQGSVELVEQCARFHIHCSARLVAEDPSVFDQKINTENLTKCLQTLKYMYHDLSVKGESCPNEAEFRAYVILLNLNDGNFMWEVQRLHPKIQKSPEVQFALNVYSAIDKNNYIRFFKLVRSTTYLNACILMRYFVQIRTRAVKTFLKSYSPRIPHTLFPIAELTRLLAFESAEATVEFLECHGLIVNPEKSHVILDRKNFHLPDYPYQLDRAVNIVESKRICSVGETVCGRSLPPKHFEYHIPEESFDSKGYLKLDNYFKEADIDIGLPDFDTPDAASDFDKKYTDRESRFSSPVVSDSDSCDVFKKESKECDKINKSVTGKDIFGIREIPPQSIFTGKQSILSKPSEEIVSEKSNQKSIFASFDSPKSFEKPPMDRVTQAAKDVNIFETSAFTSPKTSTSIFGTKTELPKSIFGVHNAVATTTVSPFFNTTAANILTPTQKQLSAAGNNIAKPQVQNKFQFGTADSAAPVTSIPVTSSLQAFMFKDHSTELEKQKQLEIEQNRLKKEIEERQKKLEEEKRRLLEEQQKLIEKKKQEELARKAEEERRKKLEQQRIEQERLRKLTEMKEQALRQLQRQEQEEKERQERLRLEREAEINKTVKALMKEVVDYVEKQIRDEKLNELASKIRIRMVKKYAKLWQNNVLKNKRKRKAVDCSPCWIYSKTIHQEAEDLSMSSQDTTLKYMKRYRRGKPFDLNPIDEEEIVKINIHELTFSHIIRRWYEFDSMLPSHLYWKVTISLPDSYEMKNGSKRIENILDQYIQWEERNNTTSLLEQVKVNPHQTVTYCIEKQQGLPRYTDDSCGFIFVANDFNTNLCNRIIESLKDIGIYVRIPIVILLQEYDENKKNLKRLIDEQIISDYVIIVDNFTTNTLINIVEEALVFLSSKVEKPPPLEMDTLKSFLDQYLCNDVWKRVISFSKWNENYKTCLKKPNVVIHLYNECVTKLKQVILNPAYLEYTHFPDVFKDFLPSDIPNSLPCDYRYFPDFWTDPVYLKNVSSLMDSLFLPKFSEKWPLDNEFELEVAMSKYCTRAFKHPEKPFYKAMSVILTNIDPNVNFEDVNNVSWVDIVEVLAAEKVNQTDFSLANTQFNNESIFNQFIVVYDPKILHDYKISDWFYINNPVIRDIIKFEVQNVKEPQQIIQPLNIDIDLDKTLADLLNKESYKEKSIKFEKDLKNVNILMKDLERSIFYTKKISSKFENVLQTILEEK